MTELERFVAELRATIASLQAREAGLTPIERIKLKSLLTNLERLLAATPEAEEGTTADCDVAKNCRCELCKLD